MKTDTSKILCMTTGGNRYDTAAAISQKYMVSADAVVLASGLNYADALAGCVFAAQRGMPMILVSNKLSAEQTEYLSSKTTENIYVLGGTGVVSDEIAQKVAQACKVPD